MAAERPLVLVIGATGVMGREVMRSLAGRCRLRALVHSDMSDAQIARRYPQAERVQCDLLEAASLEAAFAEVDRVFLLTPSVPEQLRLEEKDRKSTRLNSSHANISYAVFCLKKKKR